MLPCRNHPDVIEGVRHCSRCGGPFCSDCLVTINDRVYCATCKNEQLLDVQSGVDRTVLPYAGIGKRFAAVFIDNLIFNIPFYFVMFYFMFPAIKAGQQPPFWVNLLGVPVMFLNFFYESLMLHFRNGQTLGKMAMKVRVVRPDGSPISPGQAWGRAGLRVVIGLLCCGLPDYIPAFFRPDKTTLHDMAAATCVVDLV
jgi:uncharacterized RDD family membrane protein YckC